MTKNEIRFLKFTSFLCWFVPFLGSSIIISVARSSAKDEIKDMPTKEIAIDFLKEYKFIKSPRDLSIFNKAYDRTKDEELF